MVTSNTSLTIIFLVNLNNEKIFECEVHRPIKDSIHCERIRT